MVNTVYLCDGNEISAKEIISQLSHLELEICLFTKAIDCCHALNKKIPCAVIFNIDCLNAADRTAIKTCIHKCAAASIAISKHNDLTIHLEAIRMGCRSFFVTPVDSNLLIDKLLQIFDVLANPYHILIVDDSTILADFFATILQRAGMVTSIINDPLDINHAMVTFKPELILMDIYMPNISGLELASVLRLQSLYATIPIIFVSSEDDKSKQLAAMSLGGDDFITKPISPKYLIWSVKNRAARYRALRNLMIKDSLTGLFNFTTLINQLETELLRAQRDKSSLSFVMIDLDYFKKINDTHGHLVGNQIIKALSLTLQKRLRRIDFIARYGGEEFAVILPKTNHEQAFQICEALNKEFAKQEHRFDDQILSATFSAGIATSPPHQTSWDIIKSADRALYRAKKAGRNRVF